MTTNDDIPEGTWAEPPSPVPFVFDWHAKPEGSFLKWAVITFVSGEDRSTDFFDRVSEATNKFSDVELRIQLSGVEIDSEKFMARLDEAMEWAVKRNAKRMLREQVPGLSELFDTLHELESAVKAVVVEKAAAAGLELTHDDWNY